MADNERGTWLARLFWIVLWIDILIGLPVIMSLRIAPVPQYEVTDAILLLLCIGILGGAMTVIALTRNPVAYGIGLALAIALPLLYGNLYPLGRETPTDEALQAGHGYFRRAADRALADAIVAGDVAKAVSLVPGVNPNRVSWKDMTFMHLALARGHADVDPEVVAALLKAGVDPDGDNHLLFGFMAAVDPDAGPAIKAKNERLLAAVFDAKVDLNRLDRWGHPRYFHLLSWPAGLAQMLEHGANTEAEDTDGNTAIMSAVWNRDWRSIDVLLAHGARIDHVNRKGTSLRDMVAIASTWDREISPPIAALAARLR
jgi:Ankyrin repeat